MRILGIDPGNTHSACTVLEVGDGTPPEGIVHEKLDIPNEEFIDLLRHCYDVDLVACEMIASQGMAVGKDTFETVRWIGKFEQRLEDGIAIPWLLVYRSSIKAHICGRANAKDGNVITALVDRWDPQRRFGKYGKGTKKNPGPMYQMSSHVWQALAVAVYALENPDLYANEPLELTL